MVKFYDVFIILPYVYMREELKSYGILDNNYKFVKGYKKNKYYQEDTVVSELYIKTFRFLEDLFYKTIEKQKYKEKDFEELQDKFNYFIKHPKIKADKIARFNSTFVFLIFVWKYCRRHKSPFYYTIDALVEIFKNRLDLDLYKKSIAFVNNFIFYLQTDEVIGLDEKVKLNKLKSEIFGFKKKGE